MMMTKNLIDYVAIPKKELDIMQSQISPIKEFLKDLSFRTPKDWYTFTDAEDDIEISVSKTGIVTVTVMVYPEDTEKTIILLDKILKKICLYISDEEFAVEISILEKQKLDVERFIGKEIDLEGFRSINFKIAPETKMRISKSNDEHIISIRNSKEINRFLDIYSSVLSGKELKDLNPTEVDVMITKSIF